MQKEKKAEEGEWAGKVRRHQPHGGAAGLDSRVPLGYVLSLENACLEMATTEPYIS